MNLTRKTKVEKTTEELVLTISESEFDQAIKKVVTEKIAKDRKIIGNNPAIITFLIMDNAELAAKIRNYLFDPDKEEK